MTGPQKNKRYTYFRQVVQIGQFYYFFVLFCLFVCLFFSAQLSAFRLNMFMSTKHLNDDSFYKFAKHPKATPAEYF